MHKEKILIISNKNRALPASRSNSHISFISNSLSPYEDSAKPEPKPFEKENENIAEEATIQYIQSPIVKRDASAVCVKSLKFPQNSLANLQKEKIRSLELDLESTRQRFLVMLEEKLNIEKELILCKNKSIGGKKNCRC